MFMIEQVGLDWTSMFVPSGISETIVEYVDDVCHEADVLDEYSINMMEEYD